MQLIHTGRVSFGPLKALAPIFGVSVFDRLQIIFSGVLAPHDAQHAVTLTDGTAHRTFHAVQRNIPHRFRCSVQVLHADLEPRFNRCFSEQQAVSDELMPRQRREALSVDSQRTTHVIQKLQCVTSSSCGGRFLARRLRPAGPRQSSKRSG